MIFFGTTRIRLFLIFTTLLLTSCDCYIVVKGRILSSATELPINNAQVEFIGKNKTVTTDKNGYFKIDEQTGFCFDPHVLIRKDNYKPFDILMGGSKDSRSYEIKSEPYFIEYDEPFYPDSHNKKTLMTGTWIEKFSAKVSFLSDTIIFFLDTINVKGEIENVQNKLRAAYKSE